MRELIACCVCVPHSLVSIRDLSAFLLWLFNLKLVKYLNIFNSFLFHSIRYIIFVEEEEKRSVLVNRPNTVSPRESKLLYNPTPDFLSKRERESCHFV